jgi:hypothetical protein
MWLIGFSHGMREAAGPGGHDSAYRSRRAAVVVMRRVQDRGFLPALSTARALWNPLAQVVLEARNRIPYPPWRLCRESSVSYPGRSARRPVRAGLREEKSFLTTMQKSAEGILEAQASKARTV